MATLLGPWSVMYPLNFVAEGDTVHQGFYKHIQEIERIYGLLNALDTGKVTTKDLTDTLKSYVTTTTFNNHVNSTNPHPNLALSTLSGNLDVSRISGNLDVSRITGNWPLNRVSGTLSADNMNIDGLKTKLQSWLESSTGGIKTYSLTKNGYAIFANGLTIQWGIIPPSEDHSLRPKILFPIKFSTMAVGVWLTVVAVGLADASYNGPSHANTNTMGGVVESISLDHFVPYHIMKDDGEYVHWFGIGY